MDEWANLASQIIGYIFVQKPLNKNNFQYFQECIYFGPTVLKNIPLSVHIVSSWKFYIK